MNDHLANRPLYILENRVVNPKYKIYPLKSKNFALYKADYQIWKWESLLKLVDKDFNQYVKDSVTLYIAASQGNPLLAKRMLSSIAISDLYYINNLPINFLRIQKDNINKFSMNVDYFKQQRDNIIYS